MFERFTQQASETIFFGYHAARTAGSLYIEPAHLLVGLLRADPMMLQRIAPDSVIEDLERELAPATDEPAQDQSGPILSEHSKRALAFTAEEAESLGHRHIGTEHMVLGLLRAQNSAAAQSLHQRGITLEAFRKEVAGEAPPADWTEPEKPVAIGQIAQSRTLSVRHEGDARIVESVHTYLDHDFTVIQHFKLAPDGRSVLYSHEISGLGKRQEHTTEFPVE